MRPVVEAWLASIGLPTWLAPDYLSMGGLGGLIGGIIILYTSPEKLRPIYARALGLAYVGSYAWGHFFELVRLAPGRMLAGDWEHLFEVGRAAWGGLLGALFTGGFVLWRARVPLGPFLDRCAVAAGVIFAFVRTGCFLAGCDYGTVTSSGWGVRFPAGSLAALDHAQRGWITAGYGSLPVHPTQLYEAAFGAVAAAVMAALFAAGWFRSQLLAVYLCSYAVFRACNELLRGDVDRGVSGGISTAQLTSLLLLVCVALWALVRRGGAPTPPAY